VTTPPTTQDLLTAALDYAVRSWYVIPLHDVIQGHCSCGHPQCDAPGKYPHIVDWPHTASLDPAQIRQWWATWPHANVGIVTGERSGLAVLDVDFRNGGDLALEEGSEYDPHRKLG
jgi:Bifunctional DNA primase/polymerase, N-terminal